MTKLDLIIAAAQSGAQIARDPITREAWGLILEAPAEVPALDAIVDGHDYTVGGTREYQADGMIRYRVYCPKTWFDLWGWADPEAVEPLPCSWPDDYRIRIYRADDGSIWMVNTDNWDGIQYQDALPATEMAPGIWEAGTERRRLRPVYRFDRDGIDIDGVEENTDAWSYLTAVVEMEVR